MFKYSKDGISVLTILDTRRAKKSFSTIKQQVNELIQKEEFSIETLSVRSGRKMNDMTLRSALYALRHLGLPNITKKYMQLLLLKWGDIIQKWGNPRLSLQTYIFKYARETEDAFEKIRLVRRIIQ